MIAGSLSSCIAGAQDRYKYEQDRSRQRRWID
jgi:hypothetical protein